MDEQAIRSTIAEAGLATPPESMLLGDEAVVAPVAGDAAQAAVVDSNLVTYPAGTPVAVRNAVGAWLMFAQRAASHQVPDRDDAEAWTDAYTRALLDTGWVLRGDTGAWTTEDVQGFKVHEKILAVVSVVLGPAPAALAIVTAALTSLQQMDADSPWITLFDRRGRSATAVGFQVANCEASHGGAALHAVDFVVHAEQTLTQVLFFKFTKREASMKRRASVFELTPEALEKFGPAVEQRLGDAVLGNIAAIDLADPA
jgi:hypothetical protein